MDNTALSPSIPEILNVLAPTRRNIRSPFLVLDPFQEWLYWLLGASVPKRASKIAPTVPVLFYPLIRQLMI